MFENVAEGEPGPVGEVPFHSGDQPGVAERDTVAVPAGVLDRLEGLVFFPDTFQ
ncbi:hypothetical protein AB5J49_43980 [Streptomyces sp. R28]|uniref:Uncharacterized protein n=1 Tax=Streptomyces sp. R28 TaxID=3238628 RepID=A0AB39QAT9_9ACTN